MHQFPVRELEDNRSLGDLFSELNSELRLLVQQELALAKTELKQKLSLLGKDVAYIAGGVSVALVAFQVFVAMFVIVLALIMPLWLSALLVGVILAGVAYGLIRKGIDGLEKHDIKPDFTVKSLEEDKEWIKNQVT
jgi:hypothetical protein